ncbi:MAG TPA: XdhC family protein [Candidatus Acidoferrales bacterium]|jgi:xanthine dehydrogenase accessory factor|nr:XdhC family protein [Candidatus Acidoferrales bacterium]
MRDVFALAAEWLAEGRPFALATLVALRQAAPAPLGTTIAVDDLGHIVGNIGAGCYESEIVEACLQTASDGRTRTLEINLTSDDELAGGTACGAEMEIVVWRPPTTFIETAAEIAAGERDVRFEIVYEPEERGPVTFEYAFTSRESLLLVGATALAAEIAAVARRLDFRVIVIDPRPAFATHERVPDADEIVGEWPEDYLPRALSTRTSIVMLSHDPKLDLPGLRSALDSEAPFIGLLGSRKAQAARRSSLRADGFSQEALARIHGPVGLDIGGTTTAETALSILAEVVAARHQREGAPLRSSGGAIHSVRTPAAQPQAT